MMKPLQLHIVGFPYCKDIVGHVSEFLADAPDHCMTLRPQRNNEVDSHAIRAYDWEGRHVGYVSSVELGQAWGALQVSGSNSFLTGVIAVGINRIRDDTTAGVTFAGGNNNNNLNYNSNNS